MAFVEATFFVVLVVLVLVLVLVQVLVLVLIVVAFGDVVVFGSRVVVFFSFLSLLSLPLLFLRDATAPPHASAGRGERAQAARMMTRSIPRGDAKERSLADVVIARAVLL